MEEEGILTTEHMLLRMLDSDELVLNDGQPEYECINGNHRLAVLKDMQKLDVQFVCDICKVKCSFPPL